MLKTYNILCWCVCVCVFILPTRTTHFSCVCVERILFAMMMMTECVCVWSENRRRRTHRNVLVLYTTRTEFYMMTKQSYQINGLCLTCVRARASVLVVFSRHCGGGGSANFSFALLKY